MRHVVKIYILVISVLIISGCATGPGPGVESSKKGIMDAFLSGVQKSDGIDQPEAILLAQSQLIFRGADKKFYMDRPEVALADERHWVVRFHPINKTLAEVSSSANVLIVVDKNNGNTRWQEEE